MCVQPYIGKACGHADGAGTPLGLEPCTGRQRWEPPCASPPQLSYRLVLRPATSASQTQCDACKSAYANLDAAARHRLAAWATPYPHPHGSGPDAFYDPISEPQLARVRAALRGVYASCQRAGRRSGDPHHRFHADEEPRLQAETLNAGERFAARLRDYDDEWRDNVAFFRGQGTLGPLLRACERTRAANRAIVVDTQRSWEALSRHQEGLTDAMYERHHDVLESQCLE